STVVLPASGYHRHLHSFPTRRSSDLVSYLALLAMAAHMKKPHIQSIMMPLYQQATDIFSMKTPRNILVTSALPYANGPIHLGHILEHIQTVIWVRFQKMRGENCIYVCADDAHGAAIMLKAEEMQLSPEELIAQVKADHEKDFAAFHIHYDNYYTTHSEENRE